MSHDSTTLGRYQNAFWTFTTTVFAWFATVHKEFTLYLPFRFDNMNIPVIDFSAHTLGCKDALDENLTKEFRTAFTEVGFVYLKNTGITQQEVGHSCSSRCDLHYRKPTFRKYTSNHCILRYSWDHYICLLRWMRLWTFLRNSSFNQKNSNFLIAGKVLLTILTMDGCLSRLNGKVLYGNSCALLNKHSTSYDKSQSLYFSFFLR